MRPVFVAFLSLAACGPIQSGSLLVDAQAELAAAQTAEGDKHAPFEFVAAEEYLHKAREEQSYAEFERAVIFARKARDCARVARTKSEQSMRKELAADMAGVSTKARCRPGPERMKVMLDPDQEPNAQPVAEEPKDPPAPKKMPPKKKKVDEEPKDPEPPRDVVKPKDEPLPEGDSE